MINGIAPEEFLAMIPDSMKATLAEHGIGDRTIKLVCSFLNNVRSGVAEVLRITPKELASIKVTGNRITTQQGTYLLKHHHSLNNIEGDWVMLLSNAGFNKIEKTGEIITWTLQRDPGKLYPKAYKVFMKFLFSNFRNNQINNIDIFYDSFIRNYNEIWKEHYESPEAEV